MSSKEGAPAARMGFSARMLEFLQKIDPVRHATITGEVPSFKLVGNPVRMKGENLGRLLWVDTIVVASRREADRELVRRLMESAGCLAEVKLESESESMKGHVTSAGGKTKTPESIQGKTTAASEPFQQPLLSNPFKDPAILKMTDAQLLAYLKQTEGNRCTFDLKRLKVIAELACRGVIFRQESSS